ncbi:MAG: prepilin-type N-terminal cleavage/methylation domain-containing protein [Deltaproteobacteria bacterium]|nr:prepilin-type N-terminal cleavage/methylation domain-containing protein [Deltaproteobacteria bacterium]
MDYGPKTKKKSVVSPWSIVHGPRSMDYGPRSSSGFTLIELMVTLVIVGLIMGLAIGQVGKTLAWDFKSTTRRLSSTIRYLYNKSATEGVTLRLVFDLDEPSFWVEGTSDSFTLTREEEEAFQKKKTEDRGQKTEETEKKETTFSPQESSLTKPYNLPKGVYFKDIYAEHQIAPVDSGKAYIYFFPQGYVERSVINLRDKDDEVHYGLKVNPISGVSKIEADYIQAEVER